MPVFHRGSPAPESAAKNPHVPIPFIAANAAELHVGVVLCAAQLFYRIKVLYSGLCSSGLRRKTASFPTQSYDKSHYSVLGVSDRRYTVSPTGPSESWKCWPQPFYDGNICLCNWAPREKRISLSAKTWRSVQLMQTVVCLFFSVPLCS